MNSGYNPKVLHPDLYKVQTMSGGFQTPFFFGGAQSPIGLRLQPGSFSGSGLQNSDSKLTPKKSVYMPR